MTPPEYTPAEIARMRAGYAAEEARAARETEDEKMAKYAAHRKAAAEDAHNAAVVRARAKAESHPLLARAREASADAARENTFEAWDTARCLWLFAEPYIRDVPELLAEYNRRKTEAWNAENALR